MSNFKDKRKFQYNIIYTYLNTKTRINYTKLATKLGCCRQHARFLVDLFKNNLLLTQEHKGVGKIRKNQAQVELIVSHYKDNLKKLINANSKSANINFSVYYDFLFPKLGINLTRRTVHNYLINECIY